MGLLHPGVWYPSSWSIASKLVLQQSLQKALPLLCEAGSFWVASYVVCPSGSMWANICTSFAAKCVSYDGFPGLSDGKESACNARDVGLSPGLGRPLGGGNDIPPQYSCLENPVDRGDVL